MNHRLGDQPWGHRGGRSERMMPPRRETAPEGVAIIGLQTGKGFHLSSTPEHPHQRRPTISNAERTETTASARRKDDDSQDNTTTPPGRGTTPASAVVDGPAQHWTELSLEVCGNKTKSARHERQPTAAPTNDAPTGSGTPTTHSDHGQRTREGALTPQPAAAGGAPRAKAATSGGQRRGP